MPESHPPEKRSVRMVWGQFNAMGQLADVLRERRLRIVFAVVFCFAFGSTVLQSNLAVLLKDLLSFSPAGIGLVLAGIGVMDIVSQGFAAPRLLPRFGERRVARAGLVINGLGLLALSWLAVDPVLPLLICGIAMFTFGDGLFQPSASTLIANAAPDGRQCEVQAQTRRSNQLPACSVRLPVPGCTVLPPVRRMLWRPSLSCSPPGRFMQGQGAKLA